MINNNLQVHAWSKTAAAASGVHKADCTYTVQYIV